MKTKIFLIALFISLVSFAQETPQQELERLSKEISTFVKQEKEALKTQLEVLENQKNTGEISEEAYQSQTEKLSEESAEKISQKVSELSNQIDFLTQKIVQEALEDSAQQPIDTTDTNVSANRVDIHIGKNEKQESKRTVNRLVFAFGLNNVLENKELSSLDDSPYSIWHSNFVELGWGYKTALSKESNLVNVFYGLSFQWNELKLYDNLYHVDIDGQTLVVEHPDNLKKSKLRNSQMIIPLGFEFDFSKKEVHDGKTYYNRNEGVRLGIGGYAGLRINTKQIIKFNEPRDQKKEKIVSDYNMNNITYGLTTYLGYKDTSIYLKYDLHLLFKDTETRNVSLGVRFDF